MRQWSRVLLPVAALLTAVMLGMQPAQSTPIRGAWRIVRTSLTAGEQPNFRDYTQAGVILFTARHYSLMYVEGNEPRKMWVNPLRPTDAEKLEAFESFAGHSGTYSLEDSIVAMNVDVAKVPNLMAPPFRSTFARFVYHIRGDTLLLARRTPQGAFVMQLTRAE